MLTIRIKTDDYLQQKFIFDLPSLLTFFMNTLGYRCTKSDISDRNLTVAKIDNRNYTQIYL